MLEVVIVSLVIGVLIATAMSRKFRVLIEQRKKAFLAWLSERGLQPSWENYVAFIKDTKGQANLIDWVIGVILLAILGVGVALPIVINTIQSILPNLSGTTAMIVGIIPTIVTVVLLLMFLGRR